MKEKKKKTINPINKKYNQCFQYTVTFALNYKEIKKNKKINNKKNKTKNKRN